LKKGWVFLITLCVFFDYLCVLGNSSEALQKWFWKGETFKFIRAA